MIVAAVLAVLLMTCFLPTVDAGSGAGFVIGVIGLVLVTAVPLIMLKLLNDAVMIAGEKGEALLTGLGTFSLILGVCGIIAGLAVPGYGVWKVPKHTGARRNDGTGSGQMQSSEVTGRENDRWIRQPAAEHPEIFISHAQPNGTVPASQAPQNGGIPASQAPQNGGVPASQVPWNGGVPASRIQQSGAPASRVAGQNANAPAARPTGQVVICSTCGAPVPSNARFCTRCRTPRAMTNL